MILIVLTVTDYSEAEWEWLSRKANKKERTIFSWGDSFEIPENYLNIADESTRGTQRNFVNNYNDGSENVSEIGSYDKEISGLYDLSGNLSEWVNDYYTINFSENIVKDPWKKYILHVIKGANLLRHLQKLGPITERMELMVMI